METKTAMVTGASGFVGRRLVDSLRRCGRYSCVSEVRRPTFNLLNKTQVRPLMRQHRADVVFHLAASCGGIGANQEAPAEFFYDNMMMGMNVLDAVQEAPGNPRVVLVGTVCSYPKYAPVPFKEDDLWNGYPEETNAPYGVAKKALMVMAEAYHRQYKLDYVCALPANMYGPGDNFDPVTSHVIPAMIRKFHEADGRPVTLWGDGSPTREFLYVDDCCEGLELLAAKAPTGTVANLGTGCEVSMAELAETIRELMGSKSEITWDKSRPNGQPRRCLDVSRARALGFEAKTPLVDGLRKTIDWYRSNVGTANGR